MGFRSTVVIALNEEAYIKYALAADRLPNIMKDHFTRHEHAPGDTKTWYFHIADIKWYPSYPEVIEVHAFLDGLPEDSWGFSIAHEDGTSEEQGDPSAFEMYIAATVETPVGVFK